MLGFVEAVKLATRRYREFDGRSRRSEFWWFQLACIILSVGAIVLDGLLGFDVDSSVWTPFSTIVLFVTIVPLTSVTTRRLHDVGMTGWAQLPVFFSYIGYIPGYENFLLEFQSGAEILLGVLFVIYCVWLIIHLARDSHDGTNKYGRNPKMEDAAQTFD